jgi:hypothetical protein
MNADGLDRINSGVTSTEDVSIMTANDLLNLANSQQLRRKKSCT